MDTFAKRFKIDCSPVADKAQVYVNGGIRLTVITPCMLRVENQAQGKFCDEPTQSVWFRDFEKPEFSIKETNGRVEIKTEKATFVYSLKSKKNSSSFVSLFNSYITPHITPPISKYIFSSCTLIAKIFLSVS